MTDGTAGSSRARSRQAEPALWRTSAARALAAITLLLAATVAVAIWLSVIDARRERQDGLAHEAQHAALQIRARLLETERMLLLDGWSYPASVRRFEADMEALLQADTALLRIEMRRADGALAAAVDAPPPRALPTGAGRSPPPVELAEALAAAARTHRPVVSRPHHARAGDGGMAMVELVVPTGDDSGAQLVAVYSPQRILEQLAGAEPGAGLLHSIVEQDGTTVARRALPGQAAGAMSASAPLGPDAAGLSVRVEAARTPARLIPGVLTALVALTSLGLGLAMHQLVGDVRRRARVELALREEMAFRRSIEDAMPLSMVVFDVRGRCVHVNGALCRRTGFPPDAVVGHAAPMPFSTPDSQREYRAYRDRIAHARREGEHPEAVAARGFEASFRARDGELFPVHVVERKVRDGAGELVGRMMLCADLTERRRLEDLARRQQEALQSHSRLATLGEMASTLSHELNQPLAAITSYATACENLLDARPERPEPVRQALRSIRAQAERAGQVIRSVQSFLRRRAVERIEVDLAGLVRGLEPLLRLQAMRTGARVEIDIAPGTVAVADRIMLEQVLLNLTRNGFDAMAEVPEAQRVLGLAARRIDDERGPRVEVSVADRGRGVPLEVLPQLFTPFFTTKREGMGLGLSLCRSVIEQHGGSLAHRDRPGGGSVFAFDLPQQDASRARTVPHAAPARAGDARDGVADDARDGVAG